MLAWDVVCSLLFWLFTLASLLWGASRTVSYTQVGVGLA